jgi:hypothetical protein
MRKSKSDLIKVIYDCCDNVNREWKCDFEHWYKYDFDTEIGIACEEDLQDCNEDEIGDSKMDYIHSIRNDFCEYVLKHFVESGYIKSVADDKYNDLVYDEVFEWLIKQVSSLKVA